MVKRLVHQLLSSVTWVQIQTSDVKLHGFCQTVPWEIRVFDPNASLIQAHTNLDTINFEFNAFSRRSLLEVLTVVCAHASIAEQCDLV